MMKKLIVFILSLSVIAIAQTISEVNSFAAPFKNYGWAGYRKIKGWTCGGDASIKEYFVRLTPDRQSKSGFCWNDKPLNSNKWLTTVKFRISGQGETLFGDGMTIFFTNQNVHTAGPMHGSSDKFIGFSVDLSTYRNPDYNRYHRDISLYVGNNTSESAYYPDREHEGCFSSYRFYEKRQDFSVENAARIQISYDGDLQRVVVRSDHNNRGYYDECFSAKVNLPAEWWRNAYIGVSASTGDLADNHDVLEISTVVGVSSLENEEAITRKERENAFRAALGGLLKEEGLEMERLDPAELALASLVKALSDAELDELEKLKREMEHSMSAIDDSINTMIRKLEQRGDVSEGRITELEGQMQERVKSSVSEQIEMRIKNLELLLEKSVEREVKQKSGSWIVPFVLLTVVLSGVFFFVYVGFFGGRIDGRDSIDTYRRRICSGVFV